MPLTHSNGRTILIPSDTPIGHGVSLGDYTLSGTSWEGQQILREVGWDITAERQQQRFVRLEALTIAACIIGVIAAYVSFYTTK